MSENEMDPAANTQMFRAFVQEEQPQARRSSGGLSPAVAIGGAVVVIAIIAVAIWLAVS